MHRSAGEPFENINLILRSNSTVASHFQVKRDDETTKICQKCIEKINDYFHYRESCAAKNLYFLLRKIRVSMEKFNDVIPTGVRAVADAMCHPNILYEISSDSDDLSSESDIQWENSHRIQAEPITCISLTADTEPEDEIVIIDSPPEATHSKPEPLITVIRRIRSGQPNTSAMRKCMRGACKELFDSEDAMIYHVDNYHQKGVTVTFTCHLCKKTLGSKGSLLSHMNARHSHLDCFVCPYSLCSLVFYHKSVLKKHMRSAHDRTKVFVNSVYSVDDIDRNNRNFLFECWRCKDVFRNGDELIYHLNISHAKGNHKQFECHLCKTKTMNRHALQSHMNVNHIGPSRIICPFIACSHRVFYYESTFRAHIKDVHSQKVGLPSKKGSVMHGYGSLPIKCTSGCKNNVFESMDELRYHVHVYHARNMQKTFECHLCGKRTRSRNAHQAHMSTMHLTLKRIMCPFPMCERMLSTNRSLQRHIQIMHPFEGASNSDDTQIVDRQVSGTTRESHSIYNEK